MENFRNTLSSRIPRYCEICGKRNISKFDILCFSEGIDVDKKVSTTSIFFVLEGLVEVNYDIISNLFVEKNFFFVIPPETRYTLRILENSKIVRFQPGDELLVEYISKTSFKLYETGYYRYENGDIFFLGIEENISRLLVDFIEVKKRGFTCERYIRCKSEELLILMINYYQGEKLTQLFHPVFEKKVIFKSIVLMNRNRLFSVDEFAAATHLNRETFRQYFKTLFGMTPARWIQKERSDSIYKELIETERSVHDIMLDFGFDNFSNFARFCRMYLKKTPVEIRNEKYESEKNQAEEDQIPLEIVQNDNDILPD
ncbi:MAG: helix-turn-helix transcriptional regulator [Dysgonamonadaceae bacterium]|jgi:AraC-like DNA-binding protein|nr:helix-turn-helix transcriptional regulator [Dysgonamonadaceae bacterium]